MVPTPLFSRGTVTKWDNNFWLDLDFLDVAKAAQLCSAHFTSLLFTEIWCDANSRPQPSLNGHTEPMEIESGLTGPTGLTGVSSSNGSGLDNPHVQSLLLEAYSRIGEPDSLYGACASTHSTDDAATIRMYEHEGRWQNSLSELLTYLAGWCIKVHMLGVRNIPPLCSGVYNLRMQIPGSSCQHQLIEVT